MSDASEPDDEGSPDDSQIKFAFGKESAKKSKKEKKRQRRLSNSNLLIPTDESCDDGSSSESEAFEENQCVACAGKHDVS